MLFNNCSSVSSSTTTTTRNPEMCIWPSIRLWKASKFFVFVVLVEVVVGSIAVEEAKALVVLLFDDTGVSSFTFADDGRRKMTRMRYAWLLLH